MTLSFAQAAGYGLLGGVVAGLVGLIAAVQGAKYRSPWKQEEIRWRVLVLFAGLLIGAIVAGAAHDQMTGLWPAFVVGFCWPSVLRRILSGIEVDTKPAADSLAGIAPLGLEPVGPLGEKTVPASGGEK